MRPLLIDEQEPKKGQPFRVDGRLLENIIDVCVNRAFYRLKNVDVEPPYAVHLTMLGVSSGCLRSTHMVDAPPSACFDRDELVFPPITIDRWEGSNEEDLRELFEILWQSSGWHKRAGY